MHHPTAAASAEEASLPPSTVTRTVIVRDRRVLGKTEEGEYRRGAEGACRLFAAVEAVTMIELERCRCWCLELDGPTSARDVHAGLS